MKREMTVFQCDLPRCRKRRISPILPRRQWVELGGFHYCCAEHRDEHWTDRERIGSAGEAASMRSL
jgi:hypothetical protein